MGDGNELEGLEGLTRRLANGTGDAPRRVWWNKSTGATEEVSDWTKKATGRCANFRAAHAARGHIGHLRDPDRIGTRPAGQFEHATPTTAPVGDVIHTD